jgi:hypothetical protein
MDLDVGFKDENRADVLQFVTLVYQLDFIAFLGDHVEIVISKPYVPLTAADIYIFYKFVSAHHQQIVSIGHMDV